MVANRAGAQKHGESDKNWERMGTKEGGRFRG